ncbi:hypothetical protein NXZ77_21430 [Lysinibacillus boronitolerans]|uniref:hypothetical protein n=1 Tax=Lysinibacillus boronitolerans TaxID=309788 RepID=UPI00216329E9|nr:hypothetical protein [Lysinibacillus boronitolerans]MCS1394139.1 hypothetical protein [Lysinibacillus boronitolerans]
MTNPNPFQEFVGFLAKMGEAYREVEMTNLITELEDFNKRNYKDTAIDVALATGDREAFNKLVGSE